MKTSEKIRTLLSTWMARYAQPLVEECAQEAEQLEEENANLLVSLEYIAKTLCDTSRNDFKNVNNSLVAANEAIRKAKEK